MAKTEISKKTEADPEIKNCFIITPIGQIGSDINKKAFGLIDAVINPVLAEFNFKAVAASDISSSGSINRQIIKHITEDELVIANLTGLNANVMYELAVRHAARLPVVLMIEDGSKLPFDVFDQRTVFYNDNLNGVNDAREQLKKFVESALEDKEIQNPIYDSIEANQILQKVSTAETPFQLIFDRLDRIENSLPNSQRGMLLPKSLSRFEVKIRLKNVEQFDIVVREIVAYSTTKSITPDKFYLEGKNIIVAVFPDLNQRFNSAELLEIFATKFDVISVGRIL